MGLEAPAPTPNTRKAGTPRIAATAAVTKMASSRLEPEIREPGLADDDRGGVGSHPEEGRVAETRDIRVAPDEIQTQTEEAEDHHLRDQARNEGGDEQGQQQDDDANDDDGQDRRRSGAGDSAGRHQKTFLPISPLGRISSTARNTIQAKKSATCGM